MSLVWDEISKGMRRLRGYIGDWLAYTSEQKEVLSEMLKASQERTEPFVPSLLPKTATIEQKALAWGFVGFTILCFYHLIKAEYRLTNNVQLSLFYALLCGLFIALINEYGMDNNMLACRICRAMPENKHGEDCLLQGRTWKGKLEKDDVSFLTSVLRDEESSKADRLSASLALQAFINNP